MRPTQIEPGTAPGGLVFVTYVGEDEAERVPLCFGDDIEDVAARHGDAFAAGDLDAVLIYDGDDGRLVAALYGGT